VSPADDPTTPWWGRYTVPDDAAARLCIGPLDLIVENREGEWRVVHQRGDDPLSERQSIEVPAPLVEPPPGATVERYAFASRSVELEVLPALADRPVVIRPDTPFYLLSGEEAVLYVTTPLWVRVRTVDPPRELIDVPSYRPSDTWLGPNTREGELCYAGRTAGRLLLHELQRRPARVVTAVLLRNRAKASLLVDRLNLPVPMLSLYADTSARLWTQTVTIERESEGLLAAVKLDRTPPAEAEGARAIGEPRVKAERSILHRAFSALLS
jgi:hypothetical protein